MLDGVGISKKVWHDLTIDQPNDLARTEGEQSKIMSDIFNWSSIAKFKPFQTTSPEGRHFQRHHGVLWFCLDAGSLMLISANTKSTFKKKTGNRPSASETASLTQLCKISTLESEISRYLSRSMTDRLWMLSAPPRNKLALPKTKQSWCCAESGSTWDCHPQCKWKPVALGDMHSRISAKREKREKKDCLVTFDQGLSSQGNRLSASNITNTKADGKVTYGDTKEEPGTSCRRNFGLTSPWRLHSIAAPACLDPGDDVRFRCFLGMCQNQKFWSLEFCLEMTGWLQWLPHMSKVLRAKKRH